MDKAQKIKQLEMAKTLIYNSIDILIGQDEEQKYFKIIDAINETIYLYTNER